MAPYQVTKKRETSTALITLADDHIVRVRFKPDVEINPADLEANFVAYRELVDGHKYPFIYYAEDGSSIYSEEARNYARNNEDAFPKLCIAVVVKTLAHKLVANFYLRFNKPRTLFRVFDHMADAEDWCKGQYQAALSAGEI
jgi:hypothetical protein